MGLITIIQNKLIKRSTILFQFIIWHTRTHIVQWKHSLGSSTIFKRVRQFENHHISFPQVPVKSFFQVAGSYLPSLFSGPRHHFLPARLQRPLALSSSVCPPQPPEPSSHVKVTWLLWLELSEGLYSHLLPTTSSPTLSSFLPSPVWLLFPQLAGAAQTQVTSWWGLPRHPVEESPILSFSSEHLLLSENTFLLCVSSTWM